MFLSLTTNFGIDFQNWHKNPPEGLTHTVLQMKPLFSAVHDIRNYINPPGNSFILLFYKMRQGNPQALRKLRPEPQTPYSAALK